MNTPGFTKAIIGERLRLQIMKDKLFFNVLNFPPLGE